MVEMQRIGYIYGNEDLGVFGIHRHGPSAAARLDCLFLWTDCMVPFDAPAIKGPGMIRMTPSFAFLPTGWYGLCIGRSSVTP